MAILGVSVPAITATRPAIKTKGMKAIQTHLTIRGKTTRHPKTPTQGKGTITGKEAVRAIKVAAKPHLIKSPLIVFMVTARGLQ